MRSRASILPRSCWRAIDRSEPGWLASAFFSSRSAMRSDMECSAMAEETSGASAGGADPPRSEEHTSELQSLMRISYAVFCLKKKNNNQQSIKPNIHNHSHHT